MYSYSSTYQQNFEVQNLVLERESFGSPMPGRKYTSDGDGYRYAFNGMEQDPEIKGNGNSYTTEFRQYDPRLGRWLSLDPLMAKYPGMSPYNAFNNNPVYFVDPNGLEGQGGGKFDYTVEKGETLGELSDRFGVSLADLREANPQTQKRSMPDQINAGEVLVIPGASSVNTVGAEEGSIGSVIPLRVHFVYEKTTPEIYRFTLRMLAEGKPQVLTYNGGGAKARRNRYQATKACAGQCVKGQQSRDEYPYATAVEGGTAAGCQCVSVKEQNIQRTQLRTLYSTMKPGDKFVVFPIANKKVPRTVEEPVSDIVTEPKDVPIFAPIWVKEFGRKPGLSPAPVGVVPTIIIIPNMDIFIWQLENLLGPDYQGGQQVY